MVPSSSLDAAVPFASEPRAGALFPAQPASFEAIYDEHFSFVWRNARRLGVPDTSVDDAVQEVFLVVHRRLRELELHTSLKGWIFGILVLVVRAHRRSVRRRSPHDCSTEAPVDADTIADESANPHDRAERLEGVQLLHRLLDELDDDKRTVLVLAELEQQSAPEIAEALGENVNTVYARLRAARRDFEQAALRERARDAWRLR